MTVNGFSRCAVKDCQQLVGGGARLCAKHYARRRRHGDVNHERSAPTEMTDEKRAEIRRLIRKFVAPVDVAKRVGVSLQTVRNVMKAS